MKKYIFGSLLVGAGLLASCSLDENPESAFSQEEAMKSETLIYVNTVAAVYNSNGASLVRDIADASNFLSDEFMIPAREGDWLDGGIPQSKFLHNLAPDKTSFNGCWTACYTTISQANMAMATLEEYVDQYPICQTYINELRAYRALQYYYLMDLFGNVPLVTDAEQSTSETVQSTRSEIWDFVVKELTETLSSLSTDSSAQSGSYYGRMTKGVAYMVLAKCALNAAVYHVDPTQKGAFAQFLGDDYSGDEKVSETIGNQITAATNQYTLTIDGKSMPALDAVVYCVDQLEAEGYALTSNYADNFVVANESSTENIFTIPNDATTYQRYIDDQRRSWHYKHASHSHYKGFSSWNGPCATTFLVKKYGYTTNRQDMTTVDPRMKLNFYCDRDYEEETGEAVTDGYNNDVDPKTSEAALEYMPLFPVPDYQSAKAKIVAMKTDEYKGITDDNFYQHVVRCGGARLRKYAFDYTTSNQNYPGNDKVVFRFADALLMRAEANYRMGKLGAALSDLNLVQDRAAASGTGVVARTADYTQLSLQTISDERLKELAWEGVRRQDQIRFATLNEPNCDRYEGVGHNSGVGGYTKDTDGHVYVLPIPVEQTSVNHNLHQNYGYEGN